MCAIGMPGGAATGSLGAGNAASTPGESTVTWKGNIGSYRHWYTDLEWSDEHQAYVAVTRDDPSNT